jgi:hypothetical protein
MLFAVRGWRWVLGRLLSLLGRPKYEKHGDPHDVYYGQDTVEEEDGKDMRPNPKVDATDEDCTVYCNDAHDGHHSGNREAGCTHMTPLRAIVTTDSSRG